MKFVLVILFTLFAGLFIWWQKPVEQSMASASNSATPAGSNTILAMATSQEAAFQPKATVIVSATEQRYIELNHNPRFPTLASRQAEIHARRPDLHLSDDDILAQMQKPGAWEQSQGPAEHLQLTERQKSSGRMFMSYNATKLETIMPGDKMQVSVLENGVPHVYTIQVDSVDTYNKPRLVWRGRVDNPSNPNEELYASITQSDKVTAGSFFTPTNNYTIEAINGDGWVSVSSHTFDTTKRENDAIDPAKLKIN